MLRKKIFKILSVLVAVIIAFSCLCFSVSAKNVGYYMPIATPRVDDFSGYIELLLEHNTSKNRQVMVHSWQISYTYYTADYAFENPPDYREQEFPVLSFDLNVYSSKVTFSTGELDNGGEIKKIRLLQTTCDNTGYVLYRNLEGTKTLTNTFYLPTNYSIVSFKLCGNAKVTGVEVPLNQAIDWYTIYSDNSQQDIIDNQDKNASEIKANQDNNTNKIINGGKDSPGYSSVDKSTTDDYKSAEDEINNKTVSARSSTVSFFNNFGALLNDTPVQRGLLAVSKIMTEFFNIGWFAGLIQFALGIGAFAFILGSVIMVVGKVSSRSNSRSDSRRKK